MSLRAESPRSCAAFSGHVFLVSFSLKQFLSLSLPSWHWLFFKPQNRFLAEGTSVWVSLMFPPGLYTVDRNVTEWCCVIVSASYQEAHGAYPIASDASFNHLFREVSAKFLQCKVTVFPFVIHKYLSLTSFIIASLMILAWINYFDIWW